MQKIAERYVRLVLAVGQHDPDYVDAYYGPAEWRPDGLPRPLGELRAEAAAILDTLASTPLDDAATDGEGGEPDMQRLRRAYLVRQTQAVDTRLRMLEGERFRFDEESQGLYDAVAPTHDEAHFAALLGALEARLPGRGPVHARYDEYRRAFVVAPDRLDAVFSAAIEEGRSRTREHLALPAGERFTVEYVTGKPWSGYNWYQGGGVSLIQMNTELPIYIDRAVDLACHEGYPGHHVYNLLLEQHLVLARGWQEFTVYALFSPQSLIAEGTANFGIEVAFPGADRVAFERERLFPVAALDPARAADYYETIALVERLSYAGNEAARRYLDGVYSAAEAVDWLETYALMPRPRAEQRVRFFDRYRSYVINYNLGTDLVRRYIEARGGTADQPARRWQAFGELLSSPRLPSALRDQR